MSAAALVEVGTVLYNGISQLGKDDPDRDKPIFKWHIPSRAGSAVVEAKNQALEQDNQALRDKVQQATERELAATANNRYLKQENQSLQDRVQQAKKSESYAWNTLKVVGGVALVTGIAVGTVSVIMYAPAAAAAVAAAAAAAGTKKE